jgi:hypothetical protein
MFSNSNVVGFYKGYDSVDSYWCSILARTKGGLNKEAKAALKAATPLVLATTTRNNSWCSALPY